MVATAAPVPKRHRGPVKSQLKRNEKSVQEKLEQLHKVIDALKKTVKDMSDGHNEESKKSADAMRGKFQKLSAVIQKQTKFNLQLFEENRNLRAEKIALVTKISHLEKELERQAEAAVNSTAEAWLRNTAAELKRFLQESGLEHYGSPNFSPLIAGLVSNGVVILPLVMTALFLVRYAKQLSVLRITMALNLFDLGFAIAIIASSGLLLGDPLEGMRHISEVNFVFIQMVIGTVFWLTIGFLIAAVVQNRKNKGGRFAFLELILRIVVAVDYTRRVWGPVIDRDDVPIALPFLFYPLYLLAAITAVKLTSLTSAYSTAGYWHRTKRDEDSVTVMPDSTQHVN